MKNKQMDEENNVFKKEKSVNNIKELLDELEK